MFLSGGGGVTRSLPRNGSVGVLSRLSCWDFEKCHKWNFLTLVLGNSDSVSFPRQQTVVMAMWLIQSCRALKMNS